MSKYNSILIYAGHVDPRTVESSTAYHAICTVVEYCKRAFGPLRFSRTIVFYYRYSRYLPGKFINNIDQSGGKLQGSLLILRLFKIYVDYFIESYYVLTSGDEQVPSVTIAVSMPRFLVAIRLYKGIILESYYLVLSTTTLQKKS